MIWWIACSVVLYLLIGFVFARILCEIAPGGSANNWHWPKDTETLLFMLGLLLFWPYYLIAVIICNRRK